MLVARGSYKQWHEAVFGNSDDLLPVPQDKLKAFAFALFEIGYAPSTISNKYINGLCIWVSRF